MKNDTRNRCGTCGMPSDDMHLLTDTSMRNISSGTARTAFVCGRCLTKSGLFPEKAAIRLSKETEAACHVSAKKITGKASEIVIERFCLDDADIRNRIVKSSWRLEGIIRAWVSVWEANPMYEHDNEAFITQLIDVIEDCVGLSLHDSMTRHIMDQDFDALYGTFEEILSEHIPGWVPTPA